MLLTTITEPFGCQAIMKRINGLWLIWEKKKPFSGSIPNSGSLPIITNISLNIRRTGKSGIPIPTEGITRRQGARWLIMAMFRHDGYELRSPIPSCLAYFLACGILRCSAIRKMIRSSCWSTLKPMTFPKITLQPGQTTTGCLAEASLLQVIL